MNRSLWKLIPHEVGDGFENLSRDAALLEEKLPYPILRFYSWQSPCISYGYFREPPKEAKVPAYRRATGGGIVFHDKDLTYSLVYPRDSVLPWSIKRAYCEIHKVIQKALMTFSIDTVLCHEEKRGLFCFESPVAGDLLYKGRKVAGASQRRKGSHLLHQGTILIGQLGVDRLELVDAIVGEFEKTYHISFEHTQTVSNRMVEKESSNSNSTKLRGYGIL